MQGTLVVPIVALTLGMAACGRQPRVEAPAAVAADTLPLSPGTQIASHVSGGIGGVDDLIQVTDSWQLIVTTRDAAFVRRLDGGEQMALRDVLERFGTLVRSDSDPGPTVPDSIGSTLVARGWGEGIGTMEDAAALAEILRELAEED